MSKADTRFKILSAIYSLNLDYGVTATQAAVRVGLHRSTAQKHLAEMRADPASYGLTVRGDASGYLYSVEAEPTQAPKPKKVATVRVSPSDPTRAKVIAVLRRGSLGEFEIGQRTRIKRRLIQPVLARLVREGIATRARKRGRWLYAVAS